MTKFDSCQNGVYFDIYEIIDALFYSFDSCQNQKMKADLIITLQPEFIEVVEESKEEQQRQGRNAV